MPKVQPNTSIREDVELLILRYGSCANAAKYARLTRSTLGRIRESGRALEESTRKIQAAVLVVKNETSATITASAAAPLDLRALREMCLALIMMINWHEAWSGSAQMNSGRQG